MSEDGFLRRWSRLKSTPPEAREEPAPERAPPATAQAPAEPQVQAPEPPPVESLTADSDFSPFMQRDIDPALRRTALKKLFDDPRFNVMDGLDVYIDDYSKPDPLPEGWLEKMNQVARLGVFQPQEPQPEATREEAPAARDTAQPPLLDHAETQPEAASSNVAGEPAPAAKNDSSRGS
jgi:hypothetical protein